MAPKVMNPSSPPDERTAAGQSSLIAGHGSVWRGRTSADVTLA